MTQRNRQERELKQQLRTECEKVRQLNELVKTLVVQVNIAADGVQQLVANSTVTAGKAETEHRIDKDVQR
jgi:hypothetical protein